MVWRSSRFSSLSINTAAEPMSKLITAEWALGSVTYPVSQPRWAARTHFPGDMMSRIALAAVVALVAAAPVFAQTGTITGTVTATDGGQPIVGAQVRAGTAIAAVTRADGRYSLRVAPGAYTVRVTRLGFAADSLPNVSVVADASATANFQLRQAATQLGEVRVTVPYGGEQSGREQTGAVASVTTKEFNTG